MRKKNNLTNANLERLLGRARDKENADFEAQEYEKSRLAGGTWMDANGDEYQIPEMETTHIANAMRMLERREWAKLPASMSQKLKRQVVRLAMKEKCEYTDLWKEFEKRLTKGWVRLDHLFSCAPKGTRFVRVSKR